MSLINEALNILYPNRRFSQAAIHTAPCRKWNESELEIIIRNAVGRAFQERWLREHGDFIRTFMMVEQLEAVRPQWRDELFWVKRGTVVHVENQSWWIQEKLSEAVESSNIIRPY